MSYSYETEKPWLFTEEGSAAVHKTWRNIQVLLATAGAFRWDKVKFEGAGTSWQMCAIIDRLVELGEIEMTDRPSWTQYKVYSTPERC
jgi:hypothetical protein